MHHFTLVNIERHLPILRPVIEFVFNYVKTNKRRLYNKI